MQVLPVLVCLLEWLFSCSNVAAVPALIRPRTHLLWCLMHWCAVAGRDFMYELLVQAEAAAEAIGPWLDEHVGKITVKDLRGLQRAQLQLMLGAPPALQLTTAQRFLVVNRLKSSGDTRESTRSPRPVVVVRLTVCPSCDSLADCVGAVGSDVSVPTNPRIPALRSSRHGSLLVAAGRTAR